jgi:formylglycine-generating enzyme required for sulfatase activity
MTKRRLLRGGSFLDDTGSLRTADRDWVEPEDRGRLDGFRIVVIRGKQ